MGIENCLDGWLIGIRLPRPPGPAGEPGKARTSRITGKPGVPGKPPTAPCEPTTPPHGKPCQLEPPGTSRTSWTTRKTMNSFMRFNLSITMKSCLQRQPGPGSPGQPEKFVKPKPHVVPGTPPTDPCEPTPPS
ncbi:unnamed protein product [Caenorhabditis nigoni]